MQQRIRMYSAVDVPIIVIVDQCAWFCRAAKIEAEREV